jgi:hypothetical protein
MLMNRNLIETLNGEGHFHAKIEPLTMFLIAQGIGQAVSGAADVVGAGQQTQVLQAGQRASLSEARRQRRQQSQLLEIMRGLLAEGAPTRQAQFGAAQFGLRGLTEAAGRQPGTGPQFERALETGTRGLAQQLAQFGVSPDSSAFARSTGELAGELTGQDIDRINSILSFLSGQAPSVLPAAAQFGGLAQGAGQLAGQQVGQAAGFGQNIGAVQGGLTSSLGQRFGDVAGQFGQFKLLESLLPGLGLG